MSFDRTLDFLKARMLAALVEDERCSMSSVQIGFAETAVVLRGQVESRAHSRAAEALVRRYAPNYMDVVNELWIAGHDRPSPAPDRE